MRQSEKYIETVKKKKKEESVINVEREKSYRRKKNYPLHLPNSSP